MAYTEYGDEKNDKVLVCVHGLTRVGADFDALARAMADEYRVICPDVVGRGYSDWLANPMLYQVPTYVGDMVTLLARANAKTVHWFGTSMGGLIGMGLASLKGNPIERMILNEMGPVVTAVSLERIGSYVGRTMHFPDFATAEQYIRTVAADFGEHSDAQWHELAAGVLRDDPQGGVRLHYDPALGSAFRPADGVKVVDLELWTIYDQITCPVLAVRGEKSDLLTAETHVEMGQRGPHAELVVIKNVGHAPTFMSDDQIKIARDFLLKG
jgi:pimeloyl-ACP methyl ester carboxylesterase